MQRKRTQKYLLTNRIGGLHHREWNIFDHGEADNVWVSGSSINHGDEEEYSYSQQPIDGYEYGEMDHPLNQMVPIPHVPRINREIPSVDEATSDYERLRERLQLYDLVERKVEGDGNCQFRALSDQLLESSDFHGDIRQQIVDQLRTKRKLYEGWVPMDYDEYLHKMSNNGEWGDHVTLQAAADLIFPSLVVGRGDCGLFGDKDQPEFASMRHIPYLYS